MWSVSSRDVAREVMSEVDGAVASFEPSIRFHTLGETTVGFTVILRAREYVDQYLIRHEFVKRLRARYEAEGIVAAPDRTLAAQARA
jgi:small-conductance mechanosensitive channel